MAKYIDRLLKSTLLEQMETKNLDDITVVGLIQAAEINRKTFYNHYSGLADLLCKIVSERCDEAVIGNSTTDSWEKAVKNLMVAARDSQDFLQKVFQSNYALAARNCIRKRFDAGVLEFVKSSEARYEQRSGKRIVLTRHQEQYLVRFYSSLLFSLIEEWFMNGMKEGIDECIKLIDTLTNNGVYEGIVYFTSVGLHDKE